MLHIIYDARHLEDFFSGLSRYSYSVLKALIEDSRYTKLDIILNKGYDYYKNPLFIEIEKICTTKETFVYLDAPILSIKQHFTVSRYVNNSKCDIFFYPHFDMPVFVYKKSIFVIHDLFPLILESYILKFSFIKKIYFKAVIYCNLNKKKSFCIAVSNTTKSDILRFFGKRFEKKIIVKYENCYTDIDHDENHTTTNIINRIKNKKYLFYVGKRRKHKNLKQMIDIFNILVEKKLYNGYFFIAGNETNFYFNLEEYIKNKKNIVILGEISDNELDIMYQNMDALFFLSKYEGFGLPLIEAAKYNKKIIVSNRGACSEIAPPWSLLLNIVQDNESLAQIISRYLNKDISIESKQYLSNFSWKYTSDTIIELGYKRDG